MNIEFFTFSKKTNSTAIPTTGSGTTYTNCTLKDETSIINPVVIITAAGIPVPTAGPSILNYAHISKFQRFYYVNDWKYANGVWEAYLSVDVMGTYKSSIGALSCYIERCSYTYDGNVVDNLYPTKTDFDIQSVSVATPWYMVAPSGGCYVIGCISDTSTGAPNTLGAVSYYACTRAQLIALLQFMFSADIYNIDSISDITEGLYKAMFDPFQYVVSCMWFPETPQAFGSNSTTIKFGYWDTNIAALAMDVITSTHTASCVIPDHPQAATRGNYLNFGPYTTLNLYIPPFGVIPIDTSHRDIGNYLDSEIRVDHITGEATIRVNISPNQTTHSYINYITEKTAMFGVPIQLAQLGNQFISGGLDSSLLSTLREVATAVLGTTVGSSMNSGTPTVSTSGSNGSFLSVTNQSRLIVQHALLVDENNTIFGRPLMANATISSIPGYIKVINAPIAIAGTQTESDSIKATMENGFFYE